MSPADHLVCYKTRDASGQPRFERREVETEDQFGTRTLRVDRAQMLCVPSEKITPP